MTVLTFALGVLADVQQGSDQTIPSWATATGIIGAILGGPVFSIWFSWYMTAVRMPAIEKAHDEQMTKTIALYEANSREAERRHADQVNDSEKRHADHVNLLITNFRGDLTAMWAIKREDDGKLANALDRVSDQMGKIECKFFPPNQKQHG